jgi:hypothetical protein
MTIDRLRAEYHHQICKEIIRIQKNEGIEYPNFADGSNAASRAIAWGIIEKFNCPKNYKMISGQTAGTRFETITRNFIQEVFNRLIHLRPGEWIYSTATKISDFEQFDHLAYLEEVIKKDRKLEAALRGGYIITPDIVIGRFPVADEEINAAGEVINTNDSTANLTALRKANRLPGTKILHASISCKWTIRSDRAQNTRTEALNLIRNRKGPLPHVVAVTAEPTPHRLASLALGTGDLDCVYHFALHELLAVTQERGLEDAHAEIQMMIEGKRLRDISDLPFDLAI